jgi:hypothetical protein
LRRRAVRDYVVELEFPGAGGLGADELAAIARRSQRLATELGDGIQWRETYVSDELVFTVYCAADEQLVLEHVHRLGLVPGTVARVISVIDPTTDDPTIERTLTCDT